jgi:hypothetical protein
MSQISTRSLFQISADLLLVPGAIRQDGEALPAAHWSRDSGAGGVLLHVAVAPGTTATISVDQRLAKSAL